MQLKTGYCPHCDCEFMYHTERNYVTHAPCGQKVEVEPCEAIEEEPTIPEEEAYVEDPNYQLFAQGGSHESS